MTTTAKTNSRTTAAGTPLQHSKAEVQRLHDAEGRLSQRWAELRKSVRAAEAQAGEATLAAVMGSGHGAQDALSALVGLRDEQQAVIAAIAQAQAQRALAIRAARQAEAATLRQEADRLTAEADQHEARSRDLLRLLREHEGVSYGPLEMPSGAFIVADPIDPDLKYGVPKTIILRHEVRELELRAVALETQAVNLSGQIIAADRDDLLRQLVGDANTIRPAMPAVLVWLEPLEQRERERRARVDEWMSGYVPAGTPIGVQLVWRDGAIDPAKSRVGGA